MARISPLVTLVLGYILGYVLYPVLQAWTCSCFYDEDADITAHAQSVVARRAAMMREDKSFYDRAQAHRPIKYATWRQFFGTRAKRRGSGQPAHLSSEYTVRGRLYIAIITTEKFLATRAKAIHETWARDIDSANRIVFYVGSDCNTSYSGLEKMSIVRLENVPDSVYPPQRKVFAALQHMYRYHGNSYQWFVRADDDVYIRVMRLDRLLGRLDPNEKVYLGRAGVGKKQDMKRLQLRSHEHYCMGGPGVVLSRATLNAVAPYLGRCLNAVEAHNRIGKGVEGGVWFNEDVELGRCISRTVGIQCSNSEEVSINTVSYIIHASKITENIIMQFAFNLLLFLCSQQYKLEHTRN